MESTMLTEAEKNEWYACRDLAKLATDAAITKLVVRAGLIETGRERFVETDRQFEVGNKRPADLIRECVLFPEKWERFVVSDIEGRAAPKKLKATSRSLIDYPFVRFEAWCRLCCRKEPSWYIHYVDFIVRCPGPARRHLFTFWNRDPTSVKSGSPDDLCLFFETPQGGMFG